MKKLRFLRFSEFWSQFSIFSFTHSWMWETHTFRHPLKWAQMVPTDALTRRLFVCEPSPRRLRIKREQIAGCVCLTGMQATKIRHRYIFWAGRGFSPQSSPGEFREKPLCYFRCVRIIQNALTCASCRCVVSQGWGSVRSKAGESAKAESAESPASTSGRDEAALWPCSAHARPFSASGDGKHVGDVCCSCYVPHVSDTTGFLARSVRLISLSRMISRSIHIVANGSTWSLLAAESYSIVCM